MIDALNTILEVKEKFKVEHHGKYSDREKPILLIKSYHHDELESFGIGSEKTPQFWNMVFRRALVSCYIEKDIEQYGVIKLTQKGHEFLKEPKDFMLMEDHNFEESEEKLQEKGGVSALDSTLFAILKDLRKKIAKKEQSAPLCYFPGPVTGRHVYQLSDYPRRVS